MNIWTEYSIKYANQKSYLDDLFQVYSTVPSGIRDIPIDFERELSESYNSRDNIRLVKTLLSGALFPIKDPYIAFFKKDPSALERNPQTVNRIAGGLYALSFDEILRRISEPKEMNRQIGPMFKRWLRKKMLGLDPVGIDEFMSSDANAILDTTDSSAMLFARKHLNYSRNKGIDLVARFNKKFVVGEAKFITDEGGHQHRQFEDALELIKDTRINAIRIGILDGVLYIPSKRKMYKQISSPYNDYLIMSALVLKEFLYQV